MPARTVRLTIGRRDFARAMAARPPAFPFFGCLRVAYGASSVRCFLTADKTKVQLLTRLAFFTLNRLRRLAYEQIYRGTHRNFLPCSDNWLHGNWRGRGCYCAARHRRSAHGDGLRRRPYFRRAL